MGEVLIPIVAITASIGLPAAVIVIALLVYHKRKLAKYQVIEKAIQSNASPEVLDQLIATINQESGKKTTPPRQRNLIHGTLLLALGLSFFAIRLVVSSPENLDGVTITGLVLTLLAVAKFVIAFFIVKKDPEKS